jgi:AraC-like DNA-binding protein
MMKSVGVFIRARSLTGFVDLVSSEGGDPDRLLAAVDITREALEDPESTLPLNAVLRLFEDAAHTLKLPDFCLRLAGYQDITVLGTVALVALHSATVGEAIAAVARNLPYHTPGARLDLVDDGDQRFVQLRYDLYLAVDEPHDQAIDLALAIACKFVRMLAPNECGDLQVLVRHARGADARTYRKRFGCAVHFDQLHNAILIPRSALSVAIGSGHSALRHSAERFVGNIVRRYPLDIGRQVQTLADRLLATGDASIEQIAAQLGWHKRTLQRRLAEQGLVFEDLIDELRRTRAAEYLPYSAVPLAQVAALLGYSEQSSFSRACKRWFGKTPAVLRSGD